GQAAGHRPPRRGRVPAGDGRGRPGWAGHLPAHPGRGRGAAGAGPAGRGPGPGAGGGPPVGARPGPPGRRRGCHDVRRRRRPDRRLGARAGGDRRAPGHEPGELLPDACRAGRARRRAATAGPQRPPGPARTVRAAVRRPVLPDAGHPGRAGRVRRPGIAARRYPGARRPGRAPGPAADRPARRPDTVRGRVVPLPGGPRAARPDRPGPGPHGARLLRGDLGPGVRRPDPRPAGRPRGPRRPDDQGAVAVTPPSQSTLSFHAGDVPFTLTGPADWLTDQQRHLHDCIPASTPTASLPGVELDVYLSQGYFNTITQVVNEAPGRDLEPVPGVVLREARPEPGQRWYAIASDDVDHRPGAYAV